MMLPLYNLSYLHICQMSINYFCLKIPGRTKNNEPKRNLFILQLRYFSFMCPAEDTYKNVIVRSIYLNIESAGTRSIVAASRHTQLPSGCSVLVCQENKQVSKSRLPIHESTLKTTNNCVASCTFLV